MFHEIDDSNRTEIQRKYIDHVVGKMDFIEVRRELWHYLNQDKNRYSNYSLELEINRDAPEIFDEYYSGVFHVEGYETAGFMGE